MTKIQAFKVRSPIVVLVLAEPDIPDYEISLLQLLEKTTNGTVIEISVTGMIQS